MAAHEKLKKWRGTARQADTARRLGMSQGHYSEIETGKRRPTLDQAIAIEKVAGVRVAAWADKKKRRATKRAA